ncbi:MAG: hypothetical protein EBR79_03395, partial [Proteobacteria bacterium]|nr:hypothetical protein [Pseudomonadota bacterium]
MKIILLTRFHSQNAVSGFMSRLLSEAVALGHVLQLINPDEVVLQFGGQPGVPGGAFPIQFPVLWQGSAFPEADLVIPLCRWNDTHTWQVAETLQAVGRRVVLHNKIPLGDNVTMARLMARWGLPIPRSWVLAQPVQAAIVLPELKFPCLMRSRYGGAGRKLIVAQHSGEVFGYAEQLCRGGQSVMIQDLPEPLGEDIRALVIGEVVAVAVRRIAPEGFVRPRENGNSRVNVVELTPKETELMAGAARMYGGTFCAVSLLRTQQGPVLLEVSRAPVLAEMEMASKLNL